MKKLDWEGALVPSTPMDLPMHWIRLIWKELFTYFWVFGILHETNNTHRVTKSPLGRLNDFCFRWDGSQLSHFCDWNGHFYYVNRRKEILDISRYPVFSIFNFFLLNCVQFHQQIWLWTSGVGGGVGKGAVTGLILRAHSHRAKAEGKRTFLWCLSFVFWSFLFFLWSFSLSLPFSPTVNRPYFSTVNMVLSRDQLFLSLAFDQPNYLIDEAVRFVVSANAWSWTIGP